MRSMDLREQELDVRDPDDLLGPGSPVRPIRPNNTLKMAKYQHAFVIPDVGPWSGGVLYDKFGNLEFFADVADLEDLTKTGEDKQIPVKKADVRYYMRSKGKYSRKETTAYKSVGIQLLKGAIPGHTITLVSGTEKRQFQYNGNDSQLYAWLGENSKVIIDMYGPSGTPYVQLPVAGGGG